MIRDGKGNNIAKSPLAACLALMLALAGCAGGSQNLPTGASPQQALKDHVQLGMSYLGEGNREAARFHLRKALEIDSRSAGVHNGLGLLYQMQLEPDLADEHYRKAISLDPDFSRGRNNYGVFLYQQGRYEEAIKQFRAAAADTDYDLRPQAYENLGTAARRLGHDEEAVRAWRKAIALNPRLPGPYLDLAEYHYQQGDHARARRFLSNFDKLSRPTPRSLWLGVRLEQRFGNKDAMASKGLALEKLFPYSEQNLEYQQWLNDERRQ